MKELIYLVICFLVMFIVTGIITYEKVPQEIVINTTETSCDFQEMQNLLLDHIAGNKREISYSQVQLELLQESINDINFKNIQFYPRIRRECRSPIEFSIYGVSMQPFLYDGDKFYVERVKFEDLELGDVIVFEKDNDEKVVHSVIAIYDDFLMTAGYNNIYPDDIVEIEQILYRYCEK